jgi:protein TonB
MLRDLIYDQSDLNLTAIGAQFRQAYRRHLRRAFTASAAGHLLVGLAGFGVIVYMNSAHTATQTVRVVRYADLGPPPSITDQAAAPQVQVASAAVRPTVGIPEPVPDAEVSEDATISTQAELSQMTSLVQTEGNGDTIAVQADAPVQVVKDELVVDEEKLPALGEFVMVQEIPVPIEAPKPEYPELARRASIEGTVYIRLLVDKTGRVRDVVVDKGPEVFHQVAKDAAWKSVWKPAIQNQRPVAVWVAYPIRFKLN